MHREIRNYLREAAAVHWNITLQQVELLWFLDRADKCDELEEKCKKYENALKFYADGLHYRLENGDMILENGEVAADALGIKRKNPPSDQIIDGINLADGVEFNNDLRAMEAKYSVLVSSIKALEIAMENVRKAIYS